MTQKIVLLTVAVHGEHILKRGRERGGEERREGEGGRGGEGRERGGGREGEGRERKERGEVGKEEGHRWDEDQRGKKRGREEFI